MSTMDHAVPLQRTLRLPVVHAVLAGERLYEVLQRHVPPHIVALTDGALHLPPDVPQKDGEPACRSHNPMPRS